MSIVIEYQYMEGQQAIRSSMNNIYQRYNELRRNMTNQNQLHQLREQTLQRVRNYLTVLNSAYAKYPLSRIDNLLRNSISGSMLSNLPIYLEQIAQNQSGLQQRMIESQRDLSGRQRDKFFEGLGQLYSLYEMCRRGQGVSIDRASFEAEYYKIASSFAASQNGLAETGNILGRVGAITGAVVAANVTEQLVNSGLKTKGNAIVYDTGAKKTMHTNQTVTTDTLAVATSTSTNGGQVTATLNISDKFNASYRRGAQSTVRPVKLATRTISSFLSEVDDPQLRDDYNTALMNYLSYHAYTDDHFRRVDFTKQELSDWNLLRRAIGAEMVYNEIYGAGKGLFELNGSQYIDQIDLYMYGDRIFLADDIVNSLRRRNNTFRDFNMAQISLAKRARILRSTTNIQSQPTPIVRRGGEAAVETILSTTTLSYSQVIKFI